jgi:hypothetical protein
MNPELLHILQHSLGVDQYGRGTRYRNRFVTGPESFDFRKCKELCGLGLMEDCGPHSSLGGMHIFLVTEKGVREMSDHSPKPPKLTRPQKKYQDFLMADTGIRFSDWIKIKRSQTV